MLINVLENEDFQDSERLANIVSFARDLNNFLKGLDDLYKLQADQLKRLK